MAAVDYGVQKSLMVLWEICQLIARQLILSIKWFSHPHLMKSSMTHIQMKLFPCLSIPSFVADALTALWLCCDKLLASVYEGEPLRVYLKGGANSG